MEGVIKRTTNPINESSAPLHVAVFPWFAFGHINPFIHISNKLASHGIRISFFSAPGNIPRIKSSLSPNSPSISIIPLTFPSVDGLPAGFESTSDVSPDVAELLKVALDQMQPQIRTLLSDLKPDVVFFDFAQGWLPPLASQLGIKTVMFSVYAIISNSYLITTERISSDELPSVEDLKKPPPGYPNTMLPLKTFQAKDLMYPFIRFNGGPSALQRNYASIQGCDAVAYKSCHEMEGKYWEYFMTQIGKPLLMAGIPLPNPSSDDLDENWATWLAKFPPKSVVFSSFGSETFLTDVQIQELALGLELTGLPFLMVLSSNGFDHEKLEKALPEGFLERVQDRGMIQIGWVPQQKILAHENVGCYVNHSGFGSVMEAIVSDCQLVLLPFKGDQFLNSKLLSLDMEVGVEVNRRDEDGYFGKDDIAEAVKTVTVEAGKEPGKTIRGNLEKWKGLLMNKEFEEKYVLQLVKDVKALVGK